ncbi:hypothetical protein BT96DRAFT_1040804 [Gymnopus androsaceus JB14]|uniref:Uncharacterized protein n=1 Tax=Gymnopus androsaceus JB14 TaxID=1447944 RepID=A0A6A4HCY2_9AGAR|nr:hypothetical protein BT96DRAFT_1040804 [Gymnopus androsaceus JB14]
MSSTFIVYLPDGRPNEIRKIVLNYDLDCLDVLDRLAEKYGRERVSKELLLYKPENLPWKPRDTLLERIKSWLSTTQPTNMAKLEWLKSYFPQGPENQNREYLDILALSEQTLNSMTKHRQHLSITSDVIRREELVKSLYTHARAQRFFLVHGTPGSGKSTLCRLLHNYILDQEKDAEVQVLGIWNKNIPGGVMDAFDHAADRCKVFSYDDALRGDGTKRWMLFDEGQETYDDPRSWNTLFKPVTPHENTYIVLFASYWSAEVRGRGVDERPGTSNAINDKQRMAMWPSNDGRASGPPLPLPIAGLCLLRSEYDEMVQLRQRDFRLPRIMDDVKEWLFDITAGHIGAVDSIFQGIMEQKARLHEVSLNTFLGEANPRETLALCALGKAFERGLPTARSLSHARNASALAYLRTLLQAPEGCISYQNFNNIPEGAMRAYRLGWVVLRDNNASSIAQVRFPSPFHRHRISWLLGGSEMLRADIEAMDLMDLKQFVIAVVKLFSGRALANAARHVNSHGKDSIPEAQYQNGLYRAAYQLTGGKGIWLSPEFGTGGLSKAGRIDFFVEGTKGWGIELLREGEGRFNPGGAYHRWIQQGVVKEHIVIDFRPNNANPSKEHLGYNNLFHVIFDSTFQTLLQPPTLTLYTLGQKPQVYPCPSLFSLNKTV